MKKIVVWMLVVFFVVNAPCAFAEDAVTISFKYSDIEELFGEAMDSDTLPVDVQNSFEEIIRIYEGNAGVQDYEFATYYYCYAKGYIAFMQEDWASAKSNFDKCRIYNIGQESAYYNYAMGMLYSANGDYAEAISMFDQAANTGGSLSSRAINQSIKNTALYQDSLREAGLEAFQREDYQTAMTYFETMKSLFPESDGKELYDRCIERLNKKDELTEIVVQSVGTTTAEIVISMAPENAEVLVDMKLTADIDFEQGPQYSLTHGQKASFSMDNNNRWQINNDGGDQFILPIVDLLPGTSYRIALLDTSCKEVLCEVNFETEALVKDDNYRIARTILYTYPVVTYEMTKSVLKEGAPIWPSLASVLQMNPDFDFKLEHLLSDSNGYVVVFKVVDSNENPVPYEQIADRITEVLLHIDGVTTIAYTLADDSGKNMIKEYNSELIVLEVEEVLQGLPMGDTNLSDCIYRLDVLMSDKMLFEINGRIE